LSSALASVGTVFGRQGERRERKFIFMGIEKKKTKQKVDRLVGGKKKSKSARVFFGKAKRAALLEDDPEMEPAQINRQGEPKIGLCVLVLTLANSLCILLRFFDVRV
jgi:hypothetical protein